MSVDRINKKLRDGLKEYQDKLASGEISKPDVLDPIQKAKSKPTSLRYAINSKCYDCCGFQRYEVTVCTAKDCPLWNLRPWQRGGKEE